MTGLPPLPDAERDTGRVEAFSDGVFAIAITLLVLDLKVPHAGSRAELGAALLAQWPGYVSLLASFAVIGIMWLNHHRMFRLIRHASHGILVINGFLLFIVSAIPFPTALVAEYIGHPGGSLAAGVYTGWFVLSSMTWNVLWWFAASPRRAPPVLAVPLDSPLIRRTTASYLIGPGTYGLAFLASFWVPWLAVALCGVAALIYVLPPRRIGLPSIDGR